MSVLIYWQERLQDRKPLYSDSIAIPGFNVKAREGDSWPASVARSALLEDYLLWHEEKLLEPYRQSPMYADHPAMMPKPVDEMGFYNSLAPLIYVIGKHQQVRNYKVTIQRQFEGKWQSGTQRRYFVRLATWEEHVASFELQTGIEVHGNVIYLDVAKAQMLMKARTEWQEETDGNRKRMETSMGRDPT